MKLSLLIAILSVILNGFAQQYNFKTYSVEEGLPRSSTYSLYQDSDGYIWVGLEGGGVAVFDGYQFKTFDMTNGLPSQDVRTVFRDSRGDMWFGTMEGLCKYDFRTTTVYTTKDGLVDNYIRTIDEDENGRLWIGTNNGLSIYDGKNFVNLEAPDDILQKKVRIVKKSLDGRMWVGTNDGINIFNSSKSKKPKSSKVLEFDTVLELYQDESKNMWAGTKDGVFKFTKKDTIQYTVKKNGLVNDRVRAICQDQYGHMWFGTRTGISKFDGKRFTTYTEKNGLGHNRIRDIIRDNQGNLWFGTYFGGLSMYSGSDFVHYTTSEGILNNQIFSIYEDAKNDIQLGSFDGVSKLKFIDDRLDTVITFSEKNGLKGDRVHSLLKDSRSYYWYATDVGVTLSKDNKYYYIDESNDLPGEEVFTIYEHSDGIMWLGTSKGLCSIDFSSPKKYKVTNYPDILDRFKGSDVKTIIHDDHNNIWFGFRNGDLLCYTNKGEFIKPKLSQDITHVINLQIDNRNQLWVGTDARGLYRIELGEIDFSQVFETHLYTKEDGLGSNHVYSLMFDQEEYAWIGSETGLDKVRFNSKFEISAIKHYGIKDGLNGLEIHENACLEDFDGDLWFGTVKGVAFFNSNLDLKNSVRPKLHFKHIHVRGINDEENEGKGRHNIPEYLTLDYNQNSIDFEFVGINLSAPDGTRYKWFLEGFDEGWSNPSTRRSISYTNLPPGTYTFKVMAANENGLWTATPISFTFTIEAPFWNTWWFYVICGLTLIAVLYGFSYMRNRKLQIAKVMLETKIERATVQLRKEKEVIESQNEEIQLQRDKMGEINASITDSINYAQRIQKAIMRPNLEGESTLKNKLFSFYRPKDIVSGDFYWMAEKNNCAYIAAADCTGHGVPGAFMSMIGISYLNQITEGKGIERPDLILNHLRESVIEALANDKTDKAKDGMDISFVKIDWNTNVLEFAGANNPIYIVRNGEMEILPPNKMPVGDHDLKDVPFDLKHYDLMPNDMVYMFSDGYADQFGGAKGKKFLYKKFKQLLVDISSKPLEDQKDILKDQFMTWMGDNEQIDDILVMGIKI